MGFVCSRAIGRKSRRGGVSHDFNPVDFWWFSKKVNKIEVFRTYSIALAQLGAIYWSVRSRIGTLYNTSTLLPADLPGMKSGSSFATRINSLSKSGCRLLTTLMFFILPSMPTANCITLRLDPQQLFRVLGIFKFSEKTARIVLSEQLFLSA